jgi:hypothetical protein
MFIQLEKLCFGKQHGEGSMSKSPTRKTLCVCQG